jgi:hypothetical protein
VDACVDAVFLRRLDFPPNLAQGPRKGPLFYLWLSINFGIGNDDSVRGPKCPVPPWSRTVGEPRKLRGSFILANEFVSKERARRVVTNPALTTALLRGRSYRARSLK